MIHKQEPAARRWLRLRFDEGPDYALDWLSGFPGNYIVFLPDNQMYIGESSNVRKRLKGHVRMARYSNTWNTTWGSFGILEVAVRKEQFPFERMAVEAWLIARLKPNLNKIGRSFKPYEKSKGEHDTV